MKIAMIANGEISDDPHLNEKIRSHDLIYAVDGGLDYIHKMNLTPDLIIGDFDSAPKKLLDHYPNVTTKRYPTDKDQTDLELAIEHGFEKGATEITLFGALGKRIDHTLTNVLLLARYPQRLSIESENERLIAIDQNAEMPVTIDQTISLIPILGEASGITTEGLKWELNSSTLDKDRIGISNVVLKNKININITNGIILLTINFNS